MLLPRPNTVQLPSYSPIELADDGQISKLVYKRINKMTSFLEAILDENATTPNRFSRRFHAGSGPGIDKTVLTVQDWLSKETISDRISELNECL